MHEGVYNLELYTGAALIEDDNFPFFTLWRHMRMMMTRIARVVNVPIIGHFAFSKSGVLNDWIVCISNLLTVIKLVELNLFPSSGNTLELSATASQLILSE